MKLGFAESLDRARRYDGRRRPENAAAGRAAGFTLLEMLVVLVIIGLLAGLVGPRLLGQVDRSKVTVAETQVKMLSGALQTMRLDLGRFPSSDEGLDLLLTPPADPDVRNRWFGPYIDGSVPKDPWDRTYVYEPDQAGSQGFTLYSLGADGQPGGSGIDADVGYLPSNQ